MSVTKLKVHSQVKRVEARIKKLNSQLELAQSNTAKQQNLLVAAYQ